MRLVGVEPRLVERGVLFARSPARLKNSMTSAGDFFAKLFAWASRISLTKATARISLVCFIRCNLPRRTARQRLVTTFYIDCIEEPNLVETNNVAEVPADQNVSICDRGHCNMKHVVLELWPEDFLTLYLPSNSIASVETIRSSAPPSINSA